ncbi:MAG TPA: calcium/sodium antiporter [Planctomycetota bacterium]|nr:calcium/sodium antiporter [Planctomycetota bacterium]
MTVANVGSILFGLALLVVGAQFLVRNASKLALTLGISPLVVGLTIVAFGTSAPELAVSIQSCLSNNTNIVLGNVVGSNIYNVLFILGLCAAISPLTVAPQLIRMDVPLMICASALLYGLAFDGRLSRLDAAVLACAIVAYTIFVIVQSKKEEKGVEAEYEKDLKESLEQPETRKWLLVLLIVVGLVLLSYGSDLLVGGAVGIAKALGLSDLIIGMTIVTIGTTAPEISACLVASFRGEGDIAVGNIVGSNLFNILGVLGVGGLVAKDGIAVDPGMLGFAIPVMVAVAFSCLPIFFAGHRIARWEGLLFLAYFAFYMLHLILEAMNDTRLQALRSLVLWYVVPLTVITLIVSVWRQVKSGRTAASA